VGHDWNGIPQEMEWKPCPAEAAHLRILARKNKTRSSSAWGTPGNKIMAAQVKRKEATTSLTSTVQAVNLYKDMVQRLDKIIELLSFINRPLLRPIPYLIQTQKIVDFGLQTAKKHQMLNNILIFYQD